MTLIDTIRSAAAAGDAATAREILNGSLQSAVFSKGRDTETTGAHRAPLQEAAAAFERDMRPVREALIAALSAGDVEALRGLRALLPHLLAEVNNSPALADLLAAQLGKAFLEGIEGAEPESEITSGNDAPWDPALHPRGERGRFANAQIKANIQRGRNAMRRVLSEQQDVLNAMERQDVGSIDFVWDRLDARGKARGIKHLLDRRVAEDHSVRSAFSPEETAEKMVEVIARGQIANPHMKHGAVEIDHEGFRVVLARASKNNNAWLITGFAKIGRGTR